MLIPIGDEYPAEMIETVEVEEVAEGVRRNAQTRIPPAAVGTVEVGAQSAWVPAEAVGARKT